VRLKQSRDSVELLRGKPDEHYYERGWTSVKENRRHTAKSVIKGRIGLEKYRSYYERFELYVRYNRKENGDHVINIELDSPRYVTSKGIRIGSSRAEVEAAYGRSYGPRARYTELGLEFEMECDTVTGLRIFIPF
jgi:hypothetical protein